MPTEIPTIPAPDSLTIEVYWLVGVLLLGLATFAVLARLPVDAIEALASTPGL